MRAINLSEFGFEEPEQRRPLPPYLEIIGEPVRRSDGLAVTIYRSAIGKGGIQVDVGSENRMEISTFYLTDEVLYLGKGNLMTGVIRITKATVEQDLSYWDAETEEEFWQKYSVRPLDDELSGYWQNIAR